MVNLAMRAWEISADKLYVMEPRRNVPLVMPKLRESVEPAHEIALGPW
jgi:hypothetical protein